MDNSEADFTEVQPDFQLARLIWKVTSPFYLCVGTVGNVLSVVVLLQKNMRRSSAAVYLMALAVVDLLNLYGGPLRTCLQKFMGFDYRMTSVLACRLQTWIVYVGLDVSSWLLVIVTVERVVSVWVPHAVKYRCTRRVALMSIAVVCAGFMLVNSHFVLGLGDYVTKEGNTTVIYRCTEIGSTYRYFLMNEWPWIDLCLFCLIPFFVLVVGNVAIVTKVLLSRRKAMRHQAPTSRRRTSSMTIMLIVNNTAFIAFTLPVGVYLLLTPVGREMMSEEEYARDTLYWAIVNTFMYGASTFNFFLYFLSGSRFREEMFNLFRRCFARNRVHPSPRVETPNPACPRVFPRTDAQQNLIFVTPSSRKLLPYSKTKDLPTNKS